jgi:hypothetical protein
MQRGFNRPMIKGVFKPDLVLVISHVGDRQRYQNPVALVSSA